MIEPLYRAYAATGLSLAIRKSDWAFALIEVFHLIALAVLGGTVLIAALGLASRRFAFADRPVLWRGARITGLAALAATIISGLLLVGSNPLKYYFNASFNAKLWLLLAGLIVAVLLDWHVRKRSEAPLIASLLGLGLAGLWLAIALAGRLIGLL